MISVIVHTLLKPRRVPLAQPLVTCALQVTPLCRLCYTGYTFMSPVLHRLHLYVAWATQVTSLCRLGYTGYAFVSPGLHMWHLYVACATQFTPLCHLGYTGYTLTSPGLHRLYICVTCATQAMPPSSKVIHNSACHFLWNASDFLTEITDWGKLMYTFDLRYLQRKLVTGFQVWRESGPADVTTQ